ncbi:MAG: hypothetical protein JW787_01160 [Sedimentisphaerales bacterium]|nr:hypothetical protein [Sedimentisphaerales bacterium]
MKPNGNVVVKNCNIKSTQLIMLAIVIITSLIQIGCSEIRESSIVDLEKEFQSPPDSAKPHTWWHWMNGNVNERGITMDLEAMKNAGISGFQLFQVGANIPKGPVAFGSDENIRLVKFAAKEAERLGLEFAMHNCPGWSSTGGPWITPELSMKKLTTSETAVTSDGNTKIEVDLVQPNAQLDFYRDVFVLAFPTPATDARIPNYSTKAGIPGTTGFGGGFGGMRGMGVRDGAAASVTGGIEPASVIDISKNMDQKGHLIWSAPAGNWTVLRIGYTTTGSQNGPAPDGGAGLECDKFDSKAIEFHFNHYFGELLEAFEPLAAKGMAGILIDSYERGLQNWSVDFPVEFQKRRGYDLKGYLPAMTGRVVGDSDISERFLWDIRKTQAELMQENYYGRFAELCHEHGIKAFIEPYDPGNFNEMAAGSYADMSMGEFWQENNTHHSIKLAASISHVNGRKVMGAESFTSSQNPWHEYPYSLKSLGDFMFTEGLNRVILHSFAMQPHPTAAPGITMGRWGGFFERTNTWYAKGADWLNYIARCQYLLQQGLFTADLLYFTGENSPVRVQDPTALNPALPQGYDFDTVDAGTIIKRLKIHNGRIILPDGMSYRILILPDLNNITVEVLSRIHSLVNDGMCLMVTGTKPQSTPGLANYPAADKQVQRLADELWGDMDGITVKEHTFGKGRVFREQSVQSVLDKLSIKPDFEFTSRSGSAQVNYIHRRAGDTEIYFVANRGYKSEDLVCTFRVEGRQPEFWKADTGDMISAEIYNTVEGKTCMPIQLDPAGSVFVVFRSDAPDKHVVAVAKEGKILAGTELFPVPERPAAPAPVRGGFGFGGGGFGSFGAMRGGQVIQSEPEELPVFSLAGTSNAKDNMLFWENGTYSLTDNSSVTSVIEISGIVQPLEIAGAWKVTFPPNLGAPAQITLNELKSLHEHSENGVKYFSGTAVYTKQIEVPAETLTNDKRLFIDLGRVMVLAEVIINNKKLGILWKAPYRVDITDAVHPGSNELEIRVTNLWPNRLIGDEQLPAENEYGIVGGPPGGGGLGTDAVRKMPEWYLEGKSKTGDRITFTAWKHYSANSPLMESGLIGPVKLINAVGR